MATAEWTIMVFLNGDNNLEADGLRDYREMAKVGSTDKVNVIVQFDRNGGHASTNPQWSGGYRFKVQKNVMAKPDTALASLGDTNMGSGGTLRSFVEWAMSAYPAKRYMLDVWNHGQGWRFFRAVQPNLRGVELERFRQFRLKQLANESTRRGKFASDELGHRMLAIPPNLTVASTVKYISTDDTSNDFLYNREMQDSLAGHTFDVVGFDACLMAMVETAYAMRACGKVMVGSEELEPGTGWNYADWLNKLTSNPEMDAADLGKVLVESYRNTYSGADEATTLSAIDLSKLPNLVTRMDEFSQSLIDLNANQFAAVLEARARCSVYAPGYGLHGIDLANFAAQARTLVGAPVAAPAQSVEAAVKQAVIANYAGTDRQNEFGSTGLAIYFPENAALFQSDPDYEAYFKSNAHYPVEFVQKHKWADFVVGRYLPQT